MATLVRDGLSPAAGLLLLVWWLFTGIPAQAQEPDCARCHEEVTFSSTAHPDLTCRDCHTNVPAERRHRELEPLTDEESCGECHSRVMRAVGRSVHGEAAGCVDCHGSPHEIHKNDELASAVSPVNQIKHCGGCHNEDPELIDGYLTSEHGEALLLAGLINAPSCSDCHGDHRILAIADDRAPTAHAQSPEMCGSCHLMLLEDWKVQSAHGLAWQAGEEGPVCTDCHESHRIQDPGKADSRLSSADNCGECHAEYLTTFRDSFHGKANKLGFVSGATCADCHTPHRNLPASHPASSVNPANLAATCGACHEGITDAFASYDPHNDPTDPDDIFAVYVVWVFMTGLLLSVFAFFGLHDFLWLQRSLVGKLRGEFEPHEEGDGRYIRRFSRVNVRLHITMVVTFLLLALTGLPLKFHSADWAQQLMALIGGVDSSRFIHRVAALGTFAYALFHLGHMLKRWLVNREKGLFWGPDSLVPQGRDFADLFANIRYFLYLGKRPEADRWTYFEKFDYLAVFWGVMIIGLSGLILWLPDVFTTLLPGWVLNAAYVVHSDEALLATGFIFVFHFFHTHLRPEIFPMDIVIFTGKVPLERFKAERPLEYQRLLESNELEQHLVDPPTDDQVRNAYVLGSIFLTTGVALAAGIIWALVTYWLNSY